MKLTEQQFGIITALRISNTPLSDRFEVAWNSLEQPRGWKARYETLMDIKSPLMDEVRAHLIAAMLIA